MNLTDSADIKRSSNLLYSKSVDNNNIFTKRFLFFKYSYVRGAYYRDFVSFLEYLKPCIKKNIDDIISDFSKKGKKSKISPKIYLKDLDKMSEIVKGVNVFELPKVTGELREVQLRELEFTKELLNDIEKNTGLKPFMDDGTLLGAVRHKGFIPWDDDFDFSLMREDYQKLEEYFKSRYVWIDTSDWTNRSYPRNLEKSLNQYPNEIIVVKRSTSLKCFKLSNGNVNICDFFALDYYDDSHNIITLQNYVNSIKEKVTNFRKFGEYFKFNAEELEKGKDIVKESNTIQAGIDNFDFYNYTMKGIRRKTDIFPLQKMQFEDTEFWAPNNPDEYLKTLYNFYTKLPLFVRFAQHKD